jgi:uncharacterized protein DUF3179
LAVVTVRGALLALALTMAGCSDPAIPAALPPAPVAPRGPLAPELAGVLDALVAHPYSLDAGLIERVGRSGDPRAAWVLVDLLRFQYTNDTGAPLVDALGRLTGYRVSRRPETVAWVVYSDVLLRWDVPAPPGYLGWKRHVFVAGDEHWAPFFDDASPLDWRQVTWGGVLRNGIEALVDPKVVEARRGWWLSDDEVVFGVVVGGQPRAYPRRVMEVHELVDDSLGGRRLALSYCTLCASAIGYFTDRPPPGVSTLQLRNTGLLKRSNKLMYDAGTDSLVDQFLGTAVSGRLLRAGATLERFNVVTAGWGDWKLAHPDTTVVARDARPGREYEPDPLQGRDDRGPIFPVGQRDGRLPAQEPVLGAVTPQGVAVAFPVAEARAELRAGRPVASGGVELAVQAGGLVARQAEGGPELVGQQSFWFAWSQFRPGTLLWRAPLPR